MFRRTKGVSAEIYWRRKAQDLKDQKDSLQIKRETTFWLARQVAKATLRKNEFGNHVTFLETDVLKYAGNLIYWKMFAENKRKHLEEQFQSNSENQHTTSQYQKAFENSPEVVEEAFENSSKVEDFCKAKYNKTGRKQKMRTTQKLVMLSNRSKSEQRREARTLFKRHYLKGYAATDLRNRGEGAARSGFVDTWKKDGQRDWHGILLRANPGTTSRIEQRCDVLTKVGRPNLNGYAFFLEGGGEPKARSRQRDNLQNGYEKRCIPTPDDGDEGHARKRSAEKSERKASLQAKSKHKESAMG